MDPQNLHDRGPRPPTCTDAGDERCRSASEVGKLEILHWERALDGVTFVASGRNIRLWGVNPPARGNSYYDLARVFLAASQENGVLECKFLNRDNSDHDIMHCWVDKADLGAIIIQAGLATDFESESGGFYYYEERLAKLKRRGMWKHAEYKIEQ